MASELVAPLINEMQRETGLGYDPAFGIAQSGTCRGLSMPKSLNNSALDLLLKIPGNATLTTGIKVDLVVVDDGTNAADLGTGVVFGASVKILADNTDTADLTTGAGTEQTATATLAATSGVLRIVTISIANANLDGAAAGNWIGIRIRRVASNAGDTCQGRAIVLGAAAYAY